VSSLGDRFRLVAHGPMPSMRTIAGPEWPERSTTSSTPTRSSSHAATLASLCALREGRDPGEPPAATAFGDF